MKIRDVTTLMLHDPDAMVYQDATIYPFKPGAKGRSALFVQIHTDEGVTGLGTTMGIPACRAVIDKNLREHLIGGTGRAFAMPGTHHRLGLVLASLAGKPGVAHSKSTDRPQQERFCGCGLTRGE